GRQGGACREPVRRGDERKVVRTFRSARRSELDVAFHSRFVRPCTKPLHEFRDDRSLVLRVAPGPGPRLHLEEVLPGMWPRQVIDVHVELDAAERDEPAAPILLDLALARRLEVLAAEAR